MYYFAYGSNMNIDHMRRMCGWHCHLINRAKLPNYEIGSDLRGYANIRPNVGEVVHGVLYDMDQQGLDALDVFEGYPKVFGREEVVVLDDAEKKYKAWEYIEP